jgi:gamma-glutamylcyclotransferase (GGCT)/AIG2-like uncharacterized protein YtfP
MPGPEFIFVYGSLMRGLDLHHYMRTGTFEGEGSTEGTLVSLGRYPGLVDGPGRVRGELYSFPDLAAALDVLDDLEEYDAADPEDSLYLRVARPVKRDDGIVAIAWLYRYNGATAGHVRVAGGDWRRADADARGKG